MKTNLFLVLFIMEAGCSSSQITISGNYSWTSNLNISSAEVKLNRDSTFNYQYFVSDLYTIKSTGFWTMTSDKKHIILNSLIKGDSQLIFVDERYNSQISKGALIIRILDTANLPFHAYLNINPFNKNPRDSSDNFFINDFKYLLETNIQAFTIQDLNLYLNSPIIYRIKDLQANEIIIHFRILGERYKYFDNELWRIGKDKLIAKGTAYSKKRKIVYQKKSDFAGNKP